MATTARAASFRWQESLRHSVPASMAELVQALKRLWAEAASLAEHAYIAIQQHSFEPYWTFRAKINEHAALVAVIRGRVQQLTDLRSRQAGIVGAAVDREEQEILILTVKACLKFCFALSANPWLPIGARETFIHEIDALNQARAVLEKTPDKVPPGLLDDLDTARMILEEIIDKSPSLASFDRKPKPSAADDAAEAAVPPAGDEGVAAPAESETLSPA
jgi:hypothetical protein